MAVGLRFRVEGVNGSGFTIGFRVLAVSVTGQNHSIGVLVVAIQTLNCEGGDMTSHRSNQKHS